MQTISVSCAIIIHANKVLAVQRSSTMSHPLKWEFPGGKIERGELPYSALERELMEELSLKVKYLHTLPLVTHTYPNAEVTLHPFVVQVYSSQIQLTEHAAYQWIYPEDLMQMDWVEADVQIVKDFLSYWSQ